MGAFLLTVHQDEKALEDMAKRMNIERGQTVLVALHLLHHVLENQDQGRFISFVTDKTEVLEQVKKAANDQSDPKKTFGLNDTTQ